MLQAFKMKMNDVVEKRDRILTNQLRKSLEEKTLEITAAKKNKKNGGSFGIKLSPLFC
ncbi:hypothetical protein J6TS2_39750 [Heyndrickxia sporothermodurans]|nr:hypothetical protein J6TS2_39750 [Heyndrickxia sporothermodurans]